MTAFALRLANGQDTAARVRFGDALGLTPGAVSLAARSGLRPDGGGVVAVSSGTMDVTVTPFAAWVDGGTSDAQAGYPFFLDTTATLTLAAGDATQARVDTIVAQVQDDAYDGSGVTAATLRVVQGTPGAGAPSLPVTCVPLRDVNVPAGVSLGTGGLSGSNLGADRRQYVSAVGGVLPVSNATERDALVVQPGAVVYRRDTDKLEVRTGAGTWLTHDYEGLDSRVAVLEAGPIVKGFNTTTNVDANSRVTITFPTPFPNGIYSAVVHQYGVFNSPFGPIGDFQIENLQPSFFSFRCNGAPGALSSVNWSVIACGY